MNIERELQEALTRKRPDEGFADRVMKRRPGFSPAPNAKSRAEARPTLLWLRIAASVALVATLGGIEVHRRAEGQRARREVMLALHIASSKARLAQREVQHIAHD
jgi:hypothetical protein